MCDNQECSYKFIMDVKNCSTTECYVHFSLKWAILLLIIMFLFMKFISYPLKNTISLLLMFIISVSFIIINSLNKFEYQNICEMYGYYIQFLIFVLLLLILCYYIFALYQFKYNDIRLPSPIILVYLLIILEIISFGFYIRNCESVLPKEVVEEIIIEETPKEETQTK